MSYEKRHALEDVNGSVNVFATVAVAALALGNATVAVADQRVRLA